LHFEITKKEVTEEGLQAVYDSEEEDHEMGQLEAEEMVLVQIV